MYPSVSRAVNNIGGSQLTNLARTGGWLPTGAIDETFPRKDGTAALTLVSGRLALGGGIVIPAGRTVTSITLVSQTTALSVGSNQWFCLVDKSMNVLRKTADDTSTAWGASTAKTLTLSSTYTPTAAIEVYVGVVVVATTPPTLVRDTGQAAGVAALTPWLSGPSTTGLTNPASLGATAAALTAADNPFYAYVS